MNEITLKKCILAMIHLFLLNNFAFAGFFGEPAPVAPFTGGNIVENVQDRQYMLRASYAYSFPFSGDITKSGNGHVLVDCECGPRNADVDFSGVDFSSLYDNFQEATFAIGYKMKQNLDVFFGISTGRAGGGSTEIGTIDGHKIDGHFSDYEDFGVFVEAVQRYHRPGRLQPYFTGMLGLKLVDAMSFRLKSQNGSFDSGNMELYDDTLVFTAGIGVGVSVLLNESFEIGGDIGLRYQTGLNGIDTDLAEYDIESINDTSGAFFVPIRIYGSVYF